MEFILKKQLDKVFIDLSSDRKILGYIEKGMNLNPVRVTDTNESMKLTLCPVLECRGEMSSAGDGMCLK